MDEQNQNQTPATPAVNEVKLGLTTKDYVLGAAAIVAVGVAGYAAYSASSTNSKLNKLLDAHVASTTPAV